MFFVSYCSFKRAQVNRASCRDLRLPDRGEVAGRLVEINDWVKVYRSVLEVLRWYEPAV